MAWPLAKKNRDRIAAMIQQELPWARCTSGAARYPFIRIDRGEEIAGSRQFPGGGSAWTRPVVGSRSLLWDTDEFEIPAILEEVQPGPRQCSREQVIVWLSQPQPLSEIYTVKDVASALVLACKRWLRPVSQKAIAKQLRPNEEFRIRE